MKGVPLEKIGEKLREGLPPKEVKHGAAVEAKHGDKKEDVKDDSKMKLVAGSGSGSGSGSASGGAAVEKKELKAAPKVGQKRGAK